MSQDTPELTETLREAIDALPQPDYEAWAAEVGVPYRTIQSRKQRIDRIPGVDVEKIDGQWQRTDALADINPDNPPKRLKRDLETGGLTYEDFQAEYGLSKGEATTLIDQLRERGWRIEHTEIDANGTRVFHLADERDTAYAAGHGDGTYRFALMSDTHLGGKTVHLEELHDFYDRVQALGISQVYHAGDITDGYEVYRHHVNELKPEAIGWQRLRDYTVENYPHREGVTTHFITGNHDYKFYKANGLYFGKLLDDDRDDLNWLGEMTATIVFDAENGVDLELIHPSGGTPYTVGYRAQTLYRERPPEKRPTMAGIGHLHDKMQANAEGVEAFYTGAWQGPTAYIKRKGLPTKIGGWIVEIEIESGDLRRLNTEWIGYKTRGTENSYNAAELATI